ncbi:MAG: hypothetical protein ABI395_07645 [Sphingobium sp.]
MNSSLDTTLGKLSLTDSGGTGLLLCGFTVVLESTWRSWTRMTRDGIYADRPAAPAMIVIVPIKGCVFSDPSIDADDQQ